MTKDRLLRFGSELLVQIFGFFGFEVVVLDATADVVMVPRKTGDATHIQRSNKINARQSLYILSINPFTDLLTMIARYM